MTNVKDSSRDTSFIANDNNNDYAQQLPAYQPIEDESVTGKPNTAPAALLRPRRSGHISIPNMKANLDNPPIMQLEQAVKSSYEAAARISAAKAEQ